MSVSAGVRLVQPEDVATLAPVFARAFSTDPPMSWIFQDPSTRTDKLQVLFTGALEKVFIPHGHSYTTADLAGGALWAPPGKWRTPDEAVAEMSPVLAEVCTAEEIDRLLTFFALSEDNHPADEEHWYLGVLAADPARQGQGVGSACMRPTLEHIDAEGTPAYLESSNERNVPLYERHGFRVTGIYDLPRGGPSLWTMWRDPRPRPA